MIKYLGRKFLRPFKLQETLEYLDADVFSQSKFKNHVTQVAQNLELDEEIVRKVCVIKAAKQIKQSNKLVNMSSGVEASYIPHSQQFSVGI